MAQDASFVEHRHDQSLLSLLAKKRGLKSYPLPTTTHDVRDVWAWEAGYCKPGFEWPLPPPTLTLTLTLTPDPNPNPNPNPNQVKTDLSSSAFASTLTLTLTLTLTPNP